MTMSPRRTRFPPSYITGEAEPELKPPPCSHTITGRLPWTPEVQTLSARQSSPSETPGGSLGTAARMTAGMGAPFGLVWGELEPNNSAGRTPAHLAGGCGGMKRLAPPVGAP